MLLLGGVLHAHVYHRRGVIVQKSSRADMLLSNFVDNLIPFLVILLKRSFHVLMDHLCRPLTDLVDQIEVAVEFTMFLGHHLDLGRESIIRNIVVD